MVLYRLLWIAVVGDGGERRGVGVGVGGGGDGGGVGVMETRCCCRTLSFSTVLVSMTM